MRTVPLCRERPNAYERVLQQLFSGADLQTQWIEACQLPPKIRPGYCTCQDESGTRGASGFGLVALELGQ